MFSLFLAVVCTLHASEFVATQSTLAPEREESSQIRFYYEQNYHYIIAATASTCFMAPLTHEERDHVHISLGLEDIELRMMREWIGQLDETKIYHDDTHLPSQIRSWCKGKDIFLLERKLPVQTTHISPIASIMPGK